MAREINALATKVRTMHRQCGLYATARYCAKRNINPEWLVNVLFRGQVA